jgi:hypothetical protein
MRLAASGTPATVKRRALDPVHTLKILPVLAKFMQQPHSQTPSDVSRLTLIDVNAFEVSNLVVV